MDKFLIGYYALLTIIVELLCLRGVPFLEAACIYIYPTALLLTYLFLQDQQRKRPSREAVLDMIKSADRPVNFESMERQHQASVDMINITKSNNEPFGADMFDQLDRLLAEHGIELNMDFHGYMGL